MKNSERLLPPSFRKFKAGICLLSLFAMPLSWAQDTATNAKAGTVQTQEKNTTAPPEEKSCLEKLKLETAEKYEGLRSDWKSTVALCQNHESKEAPGKDPEAKTSQKPTLETPDYSEFLARFNNFTAKADSLYGAHLISTGETVLTDPLAAVEEKHSQALIEATNAHTRDAVLFCEKRLVQLNQDIQLLADEKSLCKKLETEAQADSKLDKPVEEGEITPASFSPSKVAIEGEVSYDTNSPHDFNSSNIYSRGGGGGGGGNSGLSSDKHTSPLVSPSSSQANPSVFSLPTGSSDYADRYFNEIFRPMDQRKPAENTSRCLSHNATFAGSKYWQLRSRVQAASINCRNLPGVNWSKEWQQFSSSNPVLRSEFKPANLSPTQTEAEFQKEQLRLASQKINYQMCQNQKFQQNFLNTVQLNSDQIQNQIAESICEITE